MNADITNAFGAAFGNIMDSYFKGGDVAIETLARADMRKAATDLGIVYLGDELVTPDLKELWFMRAFSPTNIGTNKWKYHTLRIDHQILQPTSERGRSESVKYTDGVVEGVLTRLGVECQTSMDSLITKDGVELWMRRLRGLNVDKLLTAKQWIISTIFESPISFTNQFLFGIQDRANLMQKCFHMHRNVGMLGMPNGLWKLDLQMKDIERVANVFTDMIVLPYGSQVQILVGDRIIADSVLSGGDKRSKLDPGLDYIRCRVPGKDVFEDTPAVVNGSGKMKDQLEMLARDVIFGNYSILAYDDGFFGDGKDFKYHTPYVKIRDMNSPTEWKSINHKELMDAAGMFVDAGSPLLKTPNLLVGEIENRPIELDLKHATSALSKLPDGITLYDTFFNNLKTYMNLCPDSIDDITKNPGKAIFDALQAGFVAPLKVNGNSDLEALAANLHYCGTGKAIMHLHGLNETANANIADFIGPAHKLYEAANVIISFLDTLYSQSITDRKKRFEEFINNAIYYEHDKTISYDGVDNTYARIKIDIEMITFSGDKVPEQMTKYKKMAKMSKYERMAITYVQHLKVEKGICLAMSENSLPNLISGSYILAYPHIHLVAKPALWLKSDSGRYISMNSDLDLQIGYDVYVKMVIAHYTAWHDVAILEPRGIRVAPDVRLGGLLKGLSCPRTGNFYMSDSKHFESSGRLKGPTSSNPTLMVMDIGFVDRETIGSNWGAFSLYGELEKLDCFKNLLIKGDTYSPLPHLAHYKGKFGIDNEKNSNGSAYSFVSHLPMNKSRYPPFLVETRHHVCFSDVPEKNKVYYGNDFLHGLDRVAGYLNGELTYTTTYGTIAIEK